MLCCDVSVYEVKWGDHKLEEDRNSASALTALPSQAPWPVHSAFTGRAGWHSLFSSPSPCAGPVLGFLLASVHILSVCNKACAAYCIRNSLPIAGSWHKSPFSLFFFLPADPGCNSEKGRPKGGGGGSAYLLPSSFLENHTFQGSTCCPHSSSSFKALCFLRYKVLALWPDF